MHSGFFQEILGLPASLIPYAASERLGKLAPFVLETEEASFDFEAFGRAGLATFRVKGEAHAMGRVLFRGERRRLRDALENAVLDVTWEGSTLTLMHLTWTSDGCATSRAFVLAETERLARDFFRAVCVFTTSYLGRKILVFEEGSFEKSAELYDAIRSSNFDNLVLPDETVATLRDDVRGFFAAKDAFARYGVPWKRGALFMGPPGNGKTHTIKALLGEMDVPVLYVKSLLARHATDHDCIRRIFERAREIAPCILVMEDLDALVDDGNRSVFLNELDGFAKNDGILTLATTNHVDRLDPALVERPSRFDRTYAFPLPDLPRRVAFVERWADKLEAELRPTAQAVEKVGEVTSGFSFAYLKELGTASLLAWMHRPDAMDRILELQVRKLAAHVRRGDVARVFGR